LPLIPRITTLVTQEALERLAPIWEGEAQTCHAPSSRALRERLAVDQTPRLIDGRPTLHVLVLDPLLCQFEDLAPITEMLAWRLSRVILYVGLAPIAMRNAFILARSGFSDVVLTGTADEIGQLQRAIFGNQTVSVGHHIVIRLAPHLALLPPMLRDQLVSIFVGGYPIPCVEQIAERAALSRRSMDRHLAHIGLRASGVIVSAAQLAQCFTYLKNPLVTQRRIATLFGHASIDPVKRQSELVLNRSLEETRSLSSPEEFADAVVNGLVRGSR
jgi:hypothetical protein